MVDCTCNQPTSVATIGVALIARLSTFSMLNRRWVCQSIQVVACGVGGGGRGRVLRVMNQVSSTCARL